LPAALHIRGPHARRARRAALAALAAAPPPAAARDESALEERVRVTLRGAAFAGTGERA
jgi:hypothetical protein